MFFLPQVIDILNAVFMQFSEKIIFPLNRERTKRAVFTRGFKKFTKCFSTALQVIDNEKPQKYTPTAKII